MTHIKVLRGARSGEVLEFGQERIQIGRQPDADLRFDPTSDLHVSGRHAMLFRDARGWFVRDLGSTNGTFVNGVAVSGDAEIHDGDRLEFGAGGPLVEIQLTDGGAAPSQTKVLRAHYLRENRRLRWIAGVSALALVAAGTTLVLIGGAGRREREAWLRERTELLARMDTLLVEGDVAVASLRGELEGLADALRRSQTEVRDTRTALQRLPPESGEEAVQLRRQLRSATEALARQQLAAALDFRAIEQANRHAVALIYVEGEDGVVATGTGFAVRADGTLLTVAHVIRGADGSRRPRRVAVQFSDSKQFFPARVAALAADADLAVLQVDNILGVVPVIAGFNTRPDTLAVGVAVAIIGYPLGGDLDARDILGKSVAKPLVTAAILTTTSAQRFELQGYGASGASGSPIFDAHGRVAAVLIGGRSAAGQSTLAAVPSDKAAALLEHVR